MDQHAYVIGRYSMRRIINHQSSSAAVNIFAIRAKNGYHQNYPSLTILLHIVVPRIIYVSTHHPHPHTHTAVEATQHIISHFTTDDSIPFKNEKKRNSIQIATWQNRKQQRQQGSFQDHERELERQTCLRQR